MQDERGFLEAIRAEPNDDGLRLIFADWLEERADPRGEFIRVQCALASHQDMDGKRLIRHRRKFLESREQELMSEHRDGWEKPLSDMGAANITFRRGLPEKVIMLSSDFLSHADDLFARAPIRELEIRLTHAENMVELCASPYFRNLHTLRLSGNSIGDEGARMLAESPNLRNLRTLDLSFNAITERGARILADSPNLRSLRTLVLDANRVEGAAVLREIKRTLEARKRAPYKA